ncbi:retropepsin-like aspartic protease [Cloacibacterium sp.]|uniref:retropepsin-like aspartic protease n=1 Tax=Cloacibacterium sp. TaxID=1913682 RepID=UPI0039E2BEF0
MKKILFIILFFSLVPISAQQKEDSFSVIYQLLEQKNYLKAQYLFDENKNEFSKEEQTYSKAILDNVFNKLEDSEKNIQILLNQKNVPDSLLQKLYYTKKDNLIKLYQYGKAAETIKIIQQKFSKKLSTEQMKDLENDFNLWYSLKNVPQQEVFVHNDTNLLLKQDKAGLKNINISVKQDSVDFVFDTGANISVITNSLAKKFGLEIFPSKIEVNAITGKVVTAHSAVCKELKIGKIVIKNVVFLVFEDADLAFPQIAYQINGIIGFPIIEAMNEIVITRDNHFIVSKNTKANVEKSKNMALDGLIPLIFFDENPYTFDTGANTTLLYRPYFFENQKTIEQNYQLSEIDFGGAGGNDKQKGYRINREFEVSGKKTNLDNVFLLINKSEKKGKIYGNIGQDFIQKFQKMKINFKEMFISFE